MKIKSILKIDKIRKLNKTWLSYILLSAVSIWARVYKLLNFFVHVKQHIIIKVYNIKVII